MLVNTPEVMMSSDYFEQLLTYDISQSQSCCIDRTSKSITGSKLGLSSSINDHQLNVLLLLPLAL